MGEDKLYKSCMGEIDERSRQARCDIEQGRASIADAEKAVAEVVALSKEEPKREQAVKDCKVSVYNNGSKIQTNANGVRIATLIAEDKSERRVQLAAGAADPKTGSIFSSSVLKVVHSEGKISVTRLGENSVAITYFEAGDAVVSYSTQGVKIQLGKNGVVVLTYSGQASFTPRGGEKLLKMQLCLSKTIICVDELGMQSQLPAPDTTPAITSASAPELAPAPAPAPLPSPSHAAPAPATSSEPSRYAGKVDALLATPAPAPAPKPKPKLKPKPAPSPTPAPARALSPVPLPLPLPSPSPAAPAPATSSEPSRYAGKVDALLATPAPAPASKLKPKNAPAPAPASAPKQQQAADIKDVDSSASTGDSLLVSQLSRALALDAMVGDTNSSSCSSDSSSSTSSSSNSDGGDWGALGRGEHVAMVRIARGALDAAAAQLDAAKPLLQRAEEDEATARAALASLPAAGVDKKGEGAAAGKGGVQRVSVLKEGAVEVVVLAGGAKVQRNTNGEGPVLVTLRPGVLVQLPPAGSTAGSSAGSSAGSRNDAPGQAIVQWKSGASASGGASGELLVFSLSAQARSARMGRAKLCWYPSGDRLVTYASGLVSKAQLYADGTGVVLGPEGEGGGEGGNEQAKGKGKGKGRAKALLQLSAEGVLVARDAQGAVTQYHADGRLQQQQQQGQPSVRYVEAPQRDFTYDLKTMLEEDEQGQKDKELLLNAERAKREANMQERLKEKRKKKAKAESSN